ncbi:MAG: PAS domain S-box protein, partial [Gammaproteobacteria bacterium]
MTDSNGAHNNYILDDAHFTALVLNTIASLVVVLDCQGRILVFNAACEKATGYSFEEIEGSLVWDYLIPPEQIEDVKHVFARLKAGDFPSQYENDWLTRDGGRRLIAWFNTCIVDAQGKVQYVVSTGVDITEQKQAELALRKSEERFRLLLNSTAEAIFGVDQQGICTFVNPACVEMLGYKDEFDLIGQNMHALIHHSYPDGSPYPKEHCNVRISTLNGRVAHSDDEVHWRADGSSFPVEYWSHPIYNEGMLAGAVVTFVDITERKRAEQQLLKLKHAVEQAADAIMITNLNGVIEYVNPAFEKISGYVKAE